jgi:hypothetical protein
MIAIALVTVLAMTAVVFVILVGWADIVRSEIRHLISVGRTAPGMVNLMWRKESVNANHYGPGETAISVSLKQIALKIEIP